MFVFFGSASSHIKNKQQHRVHWLLKCSIYRTRVAIFFHISHVSPWQVPSWLKKAAHDWFSLRRRMTSTVWPTMSQITTIMRPQSLLHSPLAFFSFTYVCSADGKTGSLNSNWSQEFNRGFVPAVEIQSKQSLNKFLPWLLGALLTPCKYMSEFTCGHIYTIAQFK